MATPSGTEGPGLNESPIERTLREDPCSFEFFQAVTLLHWLRKGLPVGRFSNPEEKSAFRRQQPAGVSRQPDPESSVPR